MRILFTTLLISFSTIAFAQSTHWCGFEKNLEKAVANDPSLLQKHEDLVRATAEVKASRLASEVQRGGGPRIIPVVFHVVHMGGAENISKAQIEDQIRILNEDFSRTNADTVNTRDIFKLVASIPDVEFRLAKLDPQGNCTEGINRIFSPLSENADDAVKAVSYWNSSKYYNVWVVNSIDNDGDPGTILGYAQFPGFGAAATDGVVVRADRVGSIGFAIQGDAGRTLTHETGHWLGLYHTFQGGCAGGFFGEPIDDTPPVSEANYSCSFNLNSCTNDNPDLPDQIENYMDYANGSCMNMFTLGQKDAMDAVLSGSRSNIRSANNLAQTGVDDLTPPSCAPYALFYAEETLACTGEPVSYNDDSYNGEVTTYAWEFPGGSPAVSSAANPNVTYSAPGIYSATLTVSNSQGSDSYTQTNYVRVLPSAAQVNSFFLFEGFESEEDQFFVLNDFGNQWTKSNTAFTDAHSIFISNFSGNPVGSLDEFILPSVDMRNIGNPRLYFKVAYRTRSGLADQLRVLVSADCGQTWSVRYSKTGSSLASVAGNQASAFTPATAADWKEEDFSLSNYSTAENLLVKFQSKSDAGNNIYVDDIQISGPLSIQDNDASFRVGIQPNPVRDEAILVLNMPTAEQVAISVSDITGRQVATVFNGVAQQGENRFSIASCALGRSGLFLVTVQTANAQQVQKLVVQP
jgi:PKD repeat protein